jgi:PAS domain S-box-containing protein
LRFLNEFESVTSETEQTWRVRTPSAAGDKVALQENDSYFRHLAESLPQLVWTTRPDGFHDYFSRRWSEFTGQPLEQAVGDGWTAMLHPDDQALTRERWGAALSTGKLYEIEYRIRGQDGRYRWFLGRALPIRDSSGGILRWFGTCTDIDRQKKAEEALRRLDEQHRLALEAAELGTWDYGIASGIISWDARSCALFGLEAEGIRSLPVEKSFVRIHESDRERVREALAAALDPQAEGRFDAEYRMVLPDGNMRWLHSRGQTFFAGEGPERHPVRLSGVISDVSQRRNAQEAQQLLTRELSHRVKNLFAIASGMVSMTARTARTPKDMAEALRGRLGALSRAHELVRPAFAADEQHGEATTVAKLIGAILEPYVQSDSNRMALDGPAVPVGANTTTSLALVLHELATNAAKYGSLAAPEGRLSIRWTADADELRLAWIETGGPAVTEAPGLEGFGSQLARKSITGQLGGSLEYEWLGEGLVVRMRIPLDRLGH